MERATLETLLDQGLSVEKLGVRFGKHPSTVSYWIKKYGLTARGREKHGARGGIDESRLRELVAAGLSIGEIAVAVERSKATVRHWLGKYGLRTLQTSRREQRREALRHAAEAAETPPERLRMRCRLHGETEFVREGSGYYRCRFCRSESVASHRRKLKQVLVREAGGRCLICGYDRHHRALEFHHLDPAGKAFALSRKGITLSLSALRAEALKCVLLCANCHAEVEGGALALPDTVPDEVLPEARPD